MSGGVRSGAAARRVLLIAGVFDAPTIVGMSLTWAIVGGVDFGLLIGLLVARGLVSCVYLGTLLAPLRRWSSAREASDDELRAIDGALQALPDRFAFVYALGWLLAPLLALLVSGLDGPFAAAQANAELVCAGLLVSGSTAVIYVVMKTLCWVALDASLVEVSALLGARKLALVRPSASFKRELTGFMVVMIFAMFTTFGSLMGKVRIEALREAEAARVLGDAQIAALRVEVGLSDPSELDVVVGDALPAGLAAELDESGEGAAGFEHAREQVVAAAQIGASERYVVMAGTPEEHLIISLALLLGITGAVMFGTALAAQALGSSLTTPLAELSEFARRMVRDGEIRGLDRAVPRRNNELGALMASFNALLDMLDELTGAAQSVAAGDLRVELAHSGELHDAFGLMVGHLHAMVERIRETALEVSSATAEIHASTTEHEQIANNQAEAVTELSAMLGSLTGAASNINEVAQGVLDDSERSLATSDRAAAEIAAFDRQAAEVAALLEAIREVADRSDLLALNGSLEATRAGEAGRGFGLVAAEMRRLAERVTAMVADVRTQLANLDETTTNTVGATEENRSLARGMTAAAERIVAVTRAQRDDTGHASDAAERVAESVTHAASGISQTRAACDGLQVHVGELERLTRAFELRTR